MTAVSAVVDGAIGRITLDRPEQMNAITVALGQELEDAILTLGAQSDVHVVVIQGAGGNFCAGGDFAEVERLRAQGASALKSLFVAFRRACDAIASIEVPVIAAVQGVAMAGGFELMQAADIVLTSDGARISDNHIKFGMIPGGGSTQRLPRLIGRQQALGILLSGDRLSGADAVRLGLAYRCYPDEEFNDQTTYFAATMAGRDRSAVTTIKQLVALGLGAPLSDGLDHEIESVVSHISQGAGRDGAKAFSERGVKQ